MPGSQRDRLVRLSSGGSQELECGVHPGVAYSEVGHLKFGTEMGV